MTDHIVDHARAVQLTQGNPGAMKVVAEMGTRYPDDGLDRIDQSGLQGILLWVAFNFLSEATYEKLYENLLDASFPQKVQDWYNAQQ